jgi:hypothetical protein
MTLGMVSPMMIPKAHMPKCQVNRAKRGSVNILTSESKGELEEGDCRTAAWSKASVHYFDVGVPTAEFCVYDDEAYCPVRDATKNYEQYDAEDKPSLAYCVG